MPEAYRLAGDAELAGDLGLTDADGEQLAGSQPAGLEPFTFLVCRRAASDGRHASILTRRAGPLQLGHHPSSRHPRPVKWDPAVTSITQTSPGPMGVGTTARLVRTDRGRQLQGSMEVTEYQPVSSFTEVSRFGPFTLHARATLAPVAPA